jgi:hypothetical protein
MAKSRVKTAKKKTSAKQKKRPATTKAGPKKAGSTLQRNRTRLPRDLARLDRLVEISRFPLGAAGKRVEIIRQNAILRRMNAVWNEASLEERVEMLRELIEIQPLTGDELISAYVDLGVKHGTLRGDADVDHASNDWLSRYFSGPIAEMLVNSSIVACQRSLETGLPIASYWVAGAGQDVKIAVAQGVGQVTCLLLTPSEPAIETPVRELDRAEPLWTVSDRDGAITVEQVFETALRIG